MLVVESLYHLVVQVQTTVQGLEGGPSIALSEIEPFKMLRPNSWNQNDPGTAVICHKPPGNPANAHTIVVGVSAVDAHLRHGDERGPCD